MKWIRVPAPVIAIMTKYSYDQMRFKSYTLLHLADKK
jgi:hypothetical protein